MDEIPVPDDFDQHYILMALYRAHTDSIVMPAYIIECHAGAEQLRADGLIQRADGAYTITEAGIRYWAGIVKQQPGRTIGPIAKDICKYYGGK